MGRMTTDPQPPTAAAAWLIYFPARKVWTPCDESDARLVLESMAAVPTAYHGVRVLRVEVRR